MSYRPQFGQQGAFRETLKYEDIIHNQIESIRQIFNSGEPKEIAFAVQTLLDLITPGIADDAYLHARTALDAKYGELQKAAQKEFEVKLRRAKGGCPDLVEKPSGARPLQYWKDMFYLANALLERKNLGLKIQTKAYD